MGGSLSYSLTLNYNHFVWDFDSYLGGVVVEPDYHSNAGLGWRLSLGRLFAPVGSPYPSANGLLNEEDSWVLVDGDGSRHRFFDTLHDSDPDEAPTGNVADVLYSRDGSYLRLRLLDDDTAKVDSPNGVERTFRTDGRLERIEDPFGNFLSIAYTVYRSYSIEYDTYLIWTLQDNHGRQHVITFREFPVGDIRVAVDEIDLSGFGDTTAAYTFDYDDVTIPLDPKDQQFVSEATVPLLKTITVLSGAAPTDAGSYAFSYYRDNGSDGVSGYLKSMTLPTLGRYDYDYAVYTYDYDPSGDPVFGNPAATTVGVNHRHVSDPAGNELGAWAYLPQGLLPAQCPDGPYMCFHATKTLTRTPEGHETAHYFSAIHESWTAGLPFEPDNSFGSGTASDPRRFLSRKIFDGAEDPDNLVRTEYVRYTADPGSCDSENRSACNKRLKYARTVYEDDGAKYGETFLEGFDGLGHHRTAGTGGTFTNGNVRETNVEYTPVYELLDNPNAILHVYDFDLLDPGYVSTNTFVQVPWDEPWVIETFRAHNVTEGGVTAKEEICFDDKGLLTRRRTLRGNSREPHDLLAIFSHNQQGNLEYERYYGGDNGSLGTGSHVCNMTATGSDAYGLHHTYQYGSLATSKYTAQTPGLDLSFFVTDNDIDASTGLVAASRDTSGLETTFEYDGLGRTTFVKPEEGAWVQMQYAKATASTMANVTTLSRPNEDDGTGGMPVVLAESIQHFDAFGRLKREEERLPSGSLRRRDTTYTVSGLRSSVSEWSTADPPPHTTQFMDYDPFRRPRMIQPPDTDAQAQPPTNHDIQLDYTGARLVERTVQIAAGTGGAEIGVSTTEEYDRQGRLIKVTEPSGANGSNVVTNYTYDVGNRLSGVLVGGLQQRVFQYDNRGLLVREEHPEKAANTADPMDPDACCGSVFYCDYDARGHAHRRNEGPTPANPQTLLTDSCQSRSFDLSFAFDRAERPTLIEETGGHVLEERSYFGSDDSGADPSHRKGKLNTSTRHNWPGNGTSSPNDYTISESYFYRGIGGRISERTTTATLGNATLGTWTQNFQYDDLGNPSQLTYPCLLDMTGSCTTSSPKVTYAYENGWLTSVEDFAFPPDISASVSYHGNGALDTIAFGDGWHYAQGKDPNDMQRPLWISSATGSPPIDGLELTYDGAGNVRSYGPQTFTYDKVSRVTKHDTSSGVQNYSYDAFGNLINISGTAGRSIPVRSTSNQMAGASYDQAGNVVAAGAGATFEWDKLSSLTRYTNGTVDNSYLYTADGERIAALHKGIGPATSVWTLRDLDGQVLRQFEPDPSDSLFTDGFESATTGCWSDSIPNPAGSTAGSCIPFVATHRYAHRQGKLLASVDEQVLGTPTHYYHLNYRNTANRITTDGVGEARFYYAFGEELGTSGTTFELPLKFTGHERDLGVATAGATPGDDDLDYMHARYYWPIFGRFLTFDPIGGNSRAPQSWNRYAYVLGNPLKFIDPFGLVTACVTTSDPFDITTTCTDFPDPFVLVPFVVAPGEDAIDLLGVEEARAILKRSFVSGGPGLTLISGMTLDFLDFMGIQSQTDLGLELAFAAIPGGRLGKAISRGLGNVTAGRVTAKRVLSAAERWLGKGYREIAPGVFRSADNTRQFRMTASDLIEGHVHFESVLPDGRTIVENAHVFLVE